MVTIVFFLFPIYTDFVTGRSAQSAGLLFNFKFNNFTFIADLNIHEFNAKYVHLKLSN